MLYSSVGSSIQWIWYKKSHLYILHPCNLSTLSISKNVTLCTVNTTDRSILGEKCPSE